MPMGQGSWDTANCCTCCILHDALPATNCELCALGLKPTSALVHATHAASFSGNATATLHCFVAHLRGKLKIALIYFIIEFGAVRFFSCPIQIAVKLHLILSVTICREREAEKRLSKVIETHCSFAIEFLIKASWRSRVLF